MSVQGITDWYTKVPVTPVGLRQNYVTLPAFTVTNPTWKGASEIVQQYNYTASSNFYLTARPAKPTGVNYGLCIRYRIGGDVYRYKLWEFDGLNNVVLYDKHLIKANFVVEVWSLAGELTSSQATAISLWQSIRTVPTDLTVSSSVPLAYSALVTYADLQAIVPTFSIPDGSIYGWQADSGISIALGTWTDLAVSQLILESVGAIMPGHDNSNALFNDKHTVELTGGGLVEIQRASPVYDHKHIFIVCTCPQQASDAVIFDSALCSIKAVSGEDKISIYNTDGTLAITQAIDPAKMLIVEYARRYSTPTAEDRIYKIVQDGFTLAEDTTLEAEQTPSISGITLGPVDVTASVAAIFGFTDGLSTADRAQMLAYIENKYRGTILNFPLTFNANSNWLDNS